MASRRLSFFQVATSVAIVLLTLQPAQAASQATGLIRCPDWQRYITPALAIRTTPPKQSFDAALAATRSKEQRLAVKPQAGQGVLTRTSVPTGAKTLRSKAKTTGPLDAAGIFSRNPRKTLFSKTKTQAAPCPNYIVRKGDTLGKIAKAKLSNSRRWPELAKANNLTSTSILRIGQTLRLLCAPDRQRLAGHRQSGADSTPRAPASVPLPTKPLPVWTARPGEFVSDVITRWAKRAGHSVVRDGVEEWKISVSVKIRGNFKDALDQLVVGFEGSGRPLAISLYANKVVRIGRPL